MQPREGKKKPVYYFEQMKTLANENGGRLLESEWLGATIPHRFVFADGREFTAVPHTLKTSGWPKHPESYLLKKEDRYEKIKELAKQKQGELLSPNWLGANQKHLFKHENGLTFYATPLGLINRGWPSKNSRLFKSSSDRYKEVVELAKINKGLILSTEWLGKKKQHTFVHKDGTTFYISPADLLDMGWPTDPFPYSMTPQEKMNYLNRVAKENGFSLETVQWQSNRHKMSFHSNEYGKVEASFIAIVKKGWPPVIAQVDYYAQLCYLATAHAGKVLEDKWLGESVPHRFQFKNGRQFLATPNKLKTGGWPRNEDRHQLSETQILQELKKKAEQRGGRLISDIWDNYSSLYEFEDAVGSRFLMKASSVLRGAWSHEEGLVAEPLCRQAIEHIFSANFPKDRTVLSAKNTGRQHGLELDGYNSTLKLAFEYQGYPSHWDPKHTKYLATTRRDNFKIAFCKRQNILLIVVPPLPEAADKTDSIKIFEHVFSAVQTAFAQEKRPGPILPTQPFTADLSCLNWSRVNFLELKDFAEKNGAQLLEQKWHGSDVPHRFRHANGTLFAHLPVTLYKKWPNNPRNVIDEICLSLPVLTQNDLKAAQLRRLQQKAAEFGANVCETIWSGVKSQYSFALHDGHIHSCSAERIMAASSPPWQLKSRTIISLSKSQRAPSKIVATISAKPSNEKEKLTDLAMMARSHGGDLIEDHWLGYQVKHKFKFKSGHIFSMSPKTIKSTGWPSNEAKYAARFLRNDSDRLQEFMDLAERNGGALLSLEWKGQQIKLDFVFASGVPFSMTPNQMRNRGWPQDEADYIKKVLRGPTAFYEELEKLAVNHGGRLLTKSWLGSHQDHLFQFADGRHFVMKPTKLFTRGWPQDADAYLKRYGDPHTVASLLAVINGPEM